MFEYSRTVTTTATPDAVWRLWGDPTTWSDWDPAVVAVDLAGAFAQGATGTMTLMGGIDVALTLEVVDPGHRYLDRLDMGELVIRIDHVVTGDDGPTQIIVSTTIEGPGAEDIGPMVTNDAPIAMTRLVERAESG